MSEQSHQILALQDSILHDFIHKEVGLFSKYRIMIQFRDKILGGVPKTKEMLKAWLETRGMEDKFEELKDDIDGEFPEDTTEKEKRAWTGFLKNDNGLYMSNHQVKALFKECANTIKMTTMRGNKGLKQILQHGVVVEPAQLYYQPCHHAPDGYIEMAAHVGVATGKRAILKRHDYLIQPKLEFEVWVPDAINVGGLLSEYKLKILVGLGATNGLGCCRSQGYGQFIVLEWECLVEGKGKHRVEETAKREEKKEKKAAQPESKKTKEKKELVTAV